MKTPAIIAIAAVSAAAVLSGGGVAAVAISQSHATPVAAVATPHPTKPVHKVKHHRHHHHHTAPVVVPAAPAPASGPVGYPYPDNGGYCPDGDSNGMGYCSVPTSATPPPPAANPQLTDATAVVLQYYQDLNDQNYSAAWSLGGDNLNGGTGYDQWVAGYSTTASVTVDAYGTYDDGTVWTHLTATQTDGSVKTYDGTYTVSSGVIVSANMTQTG